MSDQSQGEGWWQASDGQWYPPEPGGRSAAGAALADDIVLPDGVTLVSPWARLGAFLLDRVLYFVTLAIGWLVWGIFTGPDAQTPGKKLLDQRVVDSSTLQPISFARMFWMRGIVAGIVAAIAIVFTLGILLFMPFWDRRNQNIWDKVSSSYVVSDPHDAWGTKTNPAV